MAGEKADEALVVARDAVDVEQDPRHEEPERRSRATAIATNASEDRRRRYVHTGWPSPAAPPDDGRADPAPCRARERRATAARRRRRRAGRAWVRVRSTFEVPSTGIDRGTTSGSSRSNEDSGRVVTRSVDLRDTRRRRCHFLARPHRSVRRRALALLARTVVRALDRARRSGRAEEVARAVGETVRAAPGPARLRRPAARPLGHDRAPADARARGHARRRSRARRPRRRSSDALRSSSTSTTPSPPGATTTAAPLSTSGLNAITDLGNIKIVVVLAIVLVLVDALRRRNRWSFLFLLIVLAGMEASHARRQGSRRVASARRSNPAAATLGPSFPSGHSATAAAFYAAAALIIGRSLRRARTTVRHRRRDRHRGRRRGQPGAARPALALGRRRRSRARLGVVRALRRRLRRTATHADRSRPPRCGARRLARWLTACRPHEVAPRPRGRVVDAAR